MIVKLTELGSLSPMTILVFVTGPSSSATVALQHPPPSPKQQLDSLANMNIGNGKFSRKVDGETGCCLAAIDLS